MSTTLPTMHVHDVAPTMRVHDVAHDACPRCCPRCVPTMHPTSCSGDKTDWSDYLTSWRGKGTNRGLCDWGERIPKDATRARRWVVNGVCRQIVLKGLDFYCATNGAPTVVTGVPPPAGYRRKRKRKRKRKGGKGFQSHTPELVDGPPEETINTLKTFIFSMHVFYCTHLDPPIPQGSLAEVAVLKTFSGANCKNHLLRSIKTRFQVTHDMHPRRACRMIPTTPTHDGNPRHRRHLPEMDQQKSRCGLRQGPLRLDKGGSHL